MQIFVESQSLHQYGGFGNYSFIYVAQTDKGRSINQEGGQTSCSLSEHRSGSDCASQDNSGTDQLISRTWYIQLERTYKPHYHYQNFSPLANGTDLNREKYAILQTHWH